MSENDKQVEQSPEVSGSEKQENLITLIHEDGERKVVCKPMHVAAWKLQGFKEQVDE